MFRLSRLGLTFDGHPKDDIAGLTPNSAPPAGAPNRGYKFRELPNALFYDQIVQFADGPGEGTPVHIENGAWLHLQKQPIAYGPYPDPEKTDPNDPTDPVFAKQISVPHGNSILAYGSYTGPHDGRPMIPSVSILPSVINPRGPFSADRFDHKLDQDPHYENPDPDLAKTPTRPLQELIAQLDVEQYHSVQLHTEMDCSGNKGFVTNIEFEEKMAAARECEAGYWLMRLKGSKEFEYLAYDQNIILELVINGLHVRFPDVTSNVVKKQGPA
jgi:hypothetical protein